MANYELQPDEVILYEGTVNCKEYKGNLQLTLTSRKIIFEKEKGILKKRERTFRCSNAWTSKNL